MSNSWRVKTEGDYISPPSHIMDTPLLGYEYVMLQRLLAHSLNLPLPESGQCNIYCGVLVSDGSNIFQIFEYQSLEQRIFQQLQLIPVDKASLCHDEINKIQFDRTKKDYFPVYHFPGDACFVVKCSILSHSSAGFIPLRLSHQHRFQRRCRGYYGLPVNIMNTLILCLTTLINWSHKITGTSHDEAHVSWFTTSGNVARLLPGRRYETSLIYARFQP